VLVFAAAARRRRRVAAGHSGVQRGAAGCSGVQRDAAGCSGMQRGATARGMRLSNRREAAALRKLRGSSEQVIYTVIRENL
jgi:hypothetical protein